MHCPMCGGDDRELYAVPVVNHLGSRPVYTACYFCYLKITGKTPPPADIVPGSGAGSRAERAGRPDRTVALIS